MYDPSHARYFFRSFHYLYHSLLGLPSRGSLLCVARLFDAKIVIRLLPLFFFFEEKE